MDELSEATQASQFSLSDFGLTPWVVLALCLVPLFLLGRLQRIYPTKRLAWCTAIPFILSIPIPFFPPPLIYWPVPALGGAIVALLFFLDLFTLPSLRAIKVKRTHAKVASIGEPHPVELSIENSGERSLQMDAVDDQADGLLVEPALHHVELAPGKRTICKHTLTSLQRGEINLTHIFTRVYSWGGFWARHHQFPCQSKLHVYPDIKQIGEYALLARTNRLSQIGVRRTRKAGQDNDFERLRDFQRDDNYRHIDWRTSAKRQKLTVRQFQTDQSQRVIFLLDCGRMMTNEHNRLSLLDYSLNAVLMLSYVALDQGDSVGMLSFSDQIHSYVPPASGKMQMNRIIHAGFNEFPRMVQSRYDEAFLYLSQHCRRRSLVVLVTNTIDQVNADEIQNYMGNLIGCHLPLLVMVRDHRIFQAADNPAPDESVFYRSAAASQLLIWRDQVIRKMRARGSLTLDVFPDEMTPALVNQYLDIKARHML